MCGAAFLVAWQQPILTVMEPRRLPADHFALTSQLGCEQAARDELYIVVALLPRPAHDPVVSRMLRPSRRPPMVYCKYGFPMGVELRVEGVGVSGGIYLASRLLAGPLPIGDALRLAERVASALALAHAHGVTHDELASKTIFLPGADLARAVLLDCNFRPWRTRDDFERGAWPRDDTRVDIFALGCVLYHCLTGEEPFAGVSRADRPYHMFAHGPPALSSNMVSAPHALEVLVGEMFASALGECLTSAAELATKLAELRAALPRRDVRV